MSFYDSDVDSDPFSTSTRTSASTSSTEAVESAEELSIPPPPLPARPSALQTLPHGPIYVGDQFPYPEGQQFEFKETWGACTTSKMHETICAFLNSAGGYLLYGIQDSGKILGISRDEADKILLRADDIYHTSKIVNCVSGKTPPASAIRGSVLRLCTRLQNRPHPTERFIAILTVVNPDHNHTYRMSSGDIMIRLSASNFRSKSTTLSSFEELIRDNRALEAEKSKYYTERNRYRKEFMVMEHSHRELSIRIKECLMDVTSARAETQAALELLHARILAEKAAAERAVASNASNPTLKSWIPDWIMGCFH
jgi:hypothetical protein